MTIYMIKNNLIELLYCLLNANTRPTQPFIIFPERFWISIASIHFDWLTNERTFENEQTDCV